MHIAVFFLLLVFAHQAANAGLPQRLEASTVRQFSSNAFGDLPLSQQSQNTDQQPIVNLAHRQQLIRLKLIRYYHFKTNNIYHMRAFHVR